MDTKLNRLQLIQNHAARIIARTKKFDHISGVLKKLHWLPIKARIDYKVLLLVFKCLVGIGPSYLIRIKSGEPGFPGFSVPGRLGGVICKPEGAA